MCVSQAWTNKSLPSCIHSDRCPSRFTFFFFIWFMGVGFVVVSDLVFKMSFSIDNNHKDQDCIHGHEEFLDELEWQEKESFTSLLTGLKRIKSGIK